MYFTLDEQLNALSMVIKEAIANKATLSKDLVNLMEAQKALVETMLLGHHLDNLPAKGHAGCGGGCSHEG